MDTTLAFAVAGIIATNLITIITLYMHLDNKTDKTLRAIQEEIKNSNARWMEEMRDFHGRLCAIEERRISEN